MGAISFFFLRGWIQGHKKWIQNHGGWIQGQKGWISGHRVWIQGAEEICVRGPANVRMGHADHNVGEPLLPRWLTFILCYTEDPPPFDEHLRHYIPRIDPSV